MCIGDLGWMVGFLAVPPLLAYAQTAFSMDRGRDRWRRVEKQPVVSDASAYRAAPVVPGNLEAAPLALRVTGFTAILFGQMFVPGMLMVLVGVLSFQALGVAVLQGIPGVVLAYRLWLAGHGVLQRGLYSYRGSIRAARHVVGFNAILLTLSCAAFIVGAAFYHQRVSFVGLDVESEFLTMYGTLTAPYALLSFVQGAVMIAVVHNYRALFPADGLGEDAPDKAEACIPFVSTFASLRRKRTWQLELPLP